MRLCSILLTVLGATIATAVTTQDAKTVRLRGSILDADTNQNLPARIYIQSENGKWHFAKSASPKGSAVEYRKQRPAMPKSVEMHTTLSAHPFIADVPPGKYTITIERGHEYHPLEKQIVVKNNSPPLTFKLQRWINMAKSGWYSGETHVHRSLEELPNVMLAEDLNVAFPLVYWVTAAYAPPKSSAKSSERDPPAKVITLDHSHLIWPRNTEYEIFTVGKKRHTLGAFFVIHHKSIFERGVPPVGPIALKAHKEKALLELDKPNWPWSMMLIPVMGIDLFELSNNHHWRTEFGFTGFGVPPPKFMKIERGLNGFFSENGWIDFNFKNYYTLLNCGFRLRPTAGTASGVHPVPLGFGRAYVQCGKKLSVDNWLDGLNAGRSFVTTGPMVVADFNGKLPGHTFKLPGMTTCRVEATITSSQPLERIEIIVNGDIAHKITPQNIPSAKRSFVTSIQKDLPIESSSWLAVRCFEKRPGGRVRFAHTAPVHFDIAGKPLRPRRAEIDFLIKRVEDELKRHTGVLPESALAEYRRGLEIYRRIAKNARR